MLGTTSGETGDTDPAVIYERKRDRSFQYTITDNSCLVDADEEPPQDINHEALKKAISTSMYLNCITMSHVQYMRKIVVDGSNTSGFQRTAIIGIGGRIETGMGPVRISSICLEEDSCRKIEQEGSTVEYSLGRLGIPLMEISTEPDIKSPEHAREVAEIIGAPLIAAGWLRKGADSIRQDVNFSMGFGRVEIKGVQKLSDIESCIRYEMERQNGLRKVSEFLKGAGIPHISLTESGDLFEKTTSNILRKSMKSGLSIYVSRLTGCAGIMKKGDLRLGKELSDIVKAFGGGGLMHSDELPAFGIDHEIGPIREKLGCCDGDAFIIVTMRPQLKELMETELNSRLKTICDMTLSETRYLNQDGTTSFLRPLPGGARMYPETDVPVINILPFMEEAEKIKPVPVESVISDISEKYGISIQDSETIVRKGMLHEFLLFLEIIRDGSLSSRLLLHIIPEISKTAGREIRGEEVAELMKKAPAFDLDRETIEYAMKIHFEDNTPQEKAWEEVRKSFLSSGDLSLLVEKAASIPDISEKNLIPRLRGLTDKKFNPAVAMEMYKKLRKSR